ncbi:sigma-70 family RNA polymerase sigma factor [Brevibacillus migulae]|uniref:sigma-70 family RNA polymerase sigma factor n=1 Tax=Brevibacillus migulae TaxID=1644114 RepID=UPI00106ED7D6|nr:sigma-70 family RNA polymerase sigma factor [Brevibacillus migulae]
MTDQELQTWIKQAIAGDQTAFSALYELTLDDVYRTVAFLVNNKQDVHDVVSEVYIQLWNSLPSYDPGRPFHFWLHGLVVRQASNWKRRIWRGFRLLERTRLQEEGAAVSIDEEILREETAGELVVCISKLSYKLRVVVVYRYFHEYSLEQIAALLDIPVGTVKSRLHLALKEIRKHYEPFLKGKVEAQDAY